jgi:hypothetical protein
MTTAILTLLLVLTPPQATADQISNAQKKEFIELLKTLPYKGEFFTDDAVKRAGPYLPVLFALTEKDIADYDFYPFGAISRGLCDDEEHRRYAVTHFADIRHPTLKLSWAVMLFDSGATSPEIVSFIQNALKSKARAKMLREMIGPNFAEFKERINRYPVAKPQRQNQ